MLLAVKGLLWSWPQIKQPYSASKRKISPCRLIHRLYDSKRPTANVAENLTKSKYTTEKSHCATKILLPKYYYVYYLFCIKDYKLSCRRWIILINNYLLYSIYWNVLTCIAYYESNSTNSENRLFSLLKYHFVIQTVIY